MAFNDDDVKVRIGGDRRGLHRAARGAGKDLEDFQTRARRVSLGIAKFGVVAAAAFVGTGAAVARSAAQSGAEIRNLSRLAGIGAQDFQRIAIAANDFGVSQEKVADIIKDVNDKFGDFVATGQGPLTDFFERIAPAVGVTADQFARLSGPEALQLYVDSLEKAGVSQQEMTFYMEALASDATALVPLLQNNGRELRRLGDEAERTGRVMSNEAVASAAELDRKLNSLADTVRTKAQSAVVEYADEIVLAADFIVDDFIPAVGQMASRLAQFAEDIQPAIAALGRFVDLAATALNIDVGQFGSATLSPEEKARRDQDIRSLPGESDPSNTGAFYVDENGDVREYGVEDTPEIPGITAPTPSPISQVVRGDTSTRRGGGGGGAIGVPTSEDLERFRESFATQRELIDAEYQAQLDALREFRETKLIEEEEFNQREAALQKGHNEALSALDRSARAARLQSFSRAFGDLGALMQSENNKLFKIGQAAALADAAVSGYGAAVAAWEKGMKIGGPPLATAFTAASLARTTALISGIASQRPGSSIGAVGGGAAAATGGGAAASGAAAEAGPSSYYNVTLSGEGGISTSSVRELLEAINEEIANGGQIAGITVA